MQKINVKVICVFYTRGRILVSSFRDKELNLTCYRPLGGHIEWGETSSEAIIREIKEELQADIANPKLIGTLENRFILNGEPGHEILQIYDAGFIDKSIYLMPSIEFIESDGQKRQAIWRSLESFDEKNILVPSGLLALLKTTY